MRLPRYWEFLWTFTKREIQSRYKHTVLGFLWVFLNPFFQMIVIGAVVGFLFSPPVPNYFLFLFSGLLPWNFFSLSLDKATTAFYWNRELLRKSRFPREALPLSIVFSHGFHFLAALALFLTYFLLVGPGPIPTLFFLPLAILWEAVFLVGLVLVTSSLEVFFRDVAFFVKALLLVWFYATPVLYPLHLVPERFVTLAGLNPLSSIFSLYHHSFFGFPVYPENILVGLLVTAVVLVTGLALFRKTSPYFVDWL